MRFIRRITICLFVLYVLPVQSQEKKDSTMKAIDLDEVIISVNKAEESKRTVAQKIQVISEIQIAASQSQTSADLLTNTGTVTVQKSQAGGGSPVIRGFEASRILIVVDGVRMNNLIYRGGHLQNILSIDNTSLDRMEVLFGPSSTVYGSDALGGVVHFYTKKPRFADEDGKLLVKANAFARYGSVNDENTGHVDFNIGSNKLSSLTSFTYSDFGHVRGGENQNPFYQFPYGERPYYVERINGVDSLVKNEDRFLQVQSAYKQYDLMQKFSYKQSNNIIHTLNVQYSNTNDVPRYDRLTDPDEAGLLFAEWYYGPQKRLMAAYDLKVLMPASFFQSFHTIVSYQAIEESRHQRRFNMNNLQHRNEEVQVMSLTADVQRNTAKHHLRFGMDVQLNSLTSTADEVDITTGISTKLDTRYPDGDNSMSGYSAYVSHTWKITDKIILTDGLRLGISSLYSEIADNSFKNLPYNKIEQSTVVYSGSVGLINNPSDDVKLSLLVSSGFRVPNIDDLAKIFDPVPGTVVVPNPDLGPEKTLNAEFGITKTFGSKMSWDNTFFSTRFIDAIVTDKFTFNGEDSIMYDGTLSQVVANQNKGEAYIWGFSSGIRTEISRHMLLSFSMNYTYGRIKTDTSDYPLDHIPPFMMHLKLSYLINDFGADLVFNYNGWKKLKDYYLNGEDNEQYATPKGMPAWFTATFRASYKVHKLITLQAGVENILDTQYRTFASGINAPGRNIFGCVRFHY